MHRRRTRIVATLGPATDSPQVLYGILDAGVDVARINFSHGSVREHRQRIADFRTAARERGRIVAVLADLPGPKLRVRALEPQHLHPDTEIAFACDEDAPTHALRLTEPEVLHEVQAGHRILLDDGRLQLEAVRFEPSQLIARVTVGGPLLPNKGINLPDTPMSIPALTPRDREAIPVAVEAGVDWFALSFVRGPEAANEVRAEIERYSTPLPVLAKIERPEAVEAAEDIIRVFDGIMVARGDLGVEIPLERVPIVQKQLIRLARTAGKPVVTATDMLDSMRQNPRPTRAEASDVANAIYDGTDAVMLSGETAVGEHPVAAVACMHRIALETEAHLAAIQDRFPVERLPESQDGLDEAITRTACALARETGAEAIITPTLSGRTARLLARHRPWARIIAPAPQETIVRQMALIWGLWPVWMPEQLQLGAGRLEAAVRSAFAAGAVRAGERVVVLAGHPLEGGERLPTLRVLKIGENGRMREP